MTLTEFKTSLHKPGPPAVSNLLQALWWDAKGDWEASHNIAQDIHTEQGSWIHAYLHRKEGDTGNAAYWYHKAGRKLSTQSLSDEWEEMVTQFLISNF